MKMVTRVFFNHSDYALTALDDQDKDLILRWRNSESIRHYMYDTRIITPEMHDEWFRRELKNEKSRHFMFKEKGRSVGFVSFTDINARDRRCAWAYNLSDERDSLQKGLGAVMEYFAIEHVFEKMPIEKLCCEVLDFNTAVVRLHQRFGFIKEGFLQKHIYRDDGVFGVVVMALFREDWMKIKGDLNKTLFSAS